MLYNIKSFGIANRLTKVLSQYQCYIELGKIDNPLELREDKSTNIEFKLVIVICSYQLRIKK